MCMWMFQTNSDNIVGGEYDYTPLLQKTKKLGFLRSFLLQTIFVPPSVINKIYSKSRLANLKEIELSSVTFHPSCSVY